MTLYHFNIVLDNMTKVWFIQSVLSYLPGHVTRFQLECIILEHDCRDSDRCAQGSFADYVLL